MSKPMLVQVNCADIKEARKIAGFCVEERLAVSANIYPHMESVYWWDGQLNNEVEAVLILKTTEGQYPELEKMVKRMHSYELPCIMCLPISGGLPEYLNWMKTETKPL